MSERKKQPQTDNAAKIWTVRLKSYELHDHNGFEITLILSGKLRQMCNGVTKVLKEGDITFLSPNCIHQYSSAGEPADIINLTFPRHFVSDDVWKYADMTKIPLIIHLEGEMLSAFRETLFSILALSQKPMEPLPASTYLKNMIEWLVLKLFSHANDSAAEEDSFSPAIIYIHSHFTQQLTEQEVADL
ncbi:MAG: AraC family ligand binding domain-containing protein, partial [Clostridia bacterium]|nr:AraC family ligand binding domain-containing protein [Clostridia bacterium]